jgi:hypothetical protein
MTKTPIDEMSVSIQTDCSEPGESYNCEVFDLTQLTKKEEEK